MTAWLEYCCKLHSNVHTHTHTLTQWMCREAVLYMIIEWVCVRQWGGWNTKQTNNKKQLEKQRFMNDAKSLLHSMNVYVFAGGSAVKTIRGALPPETNWTASGDGAAWRNFICTDDLHNMLMCIAHKAICIMRCVGVSVIEARRNIRHSKSSVFILLVESERARDGAVWDGETNGEVIDDGRRGAGMAAAPRSSDWTSVGANRYVPLSDKLNPKTGSTNRFDNSRPNKRLCPTTLEQHQIISSMQTMSCVPQ